jgi:hypothetical protein
MILVQLPEEPVTTIAENDGKPVLVTTMPPPTLVTWADPLEFAAKVDHARDEYAKGFYQYGDHKGQPLPRTGCGYPARVDEFPTLESYLAPAELDDTQSAAHGVQGQQVHGPLGTEPSVGEGCRGAEHVAPHLR